MCHVKQYLDDSIETAGVGVYIQTLGGESDFMREGDINFKKPVWSLEHEPTHSLSQRLPISFSGGDDQNNDINSKNLEVLFHKITDINAKTALRHSIQSHHHVISIYNTKQNYVSVPQRW